MPSFCRFTLGTPGASAVHLRYVSRADAVLERREGAIFRNLPEEATSPKGYRELRSALESFAWAREESEESLHRRRGSRGTLRSHYRCVLSFERDASTANIRNMVQEWLRETLPLAGIAGFVHRNTDHVHVHLWIDARGTDGRKLDFSPREWRRFDKAWSRIYEREMAREDRLDEGQGRQVLEGREEGDEKGRAPGGGVRAGNGAAPEPSERTPAQGEEPEIDACAQSRVRALREAQALRREIEAMARGLPGRDDPPADPRRER